MASQDLRSFLELLEENGELQRVKAEVDPKHELGAICSTLNRNPDNPAVLFERVKGHDIPVVSQLLANNKRIALALDVSENRLFEEIIERSKHALPPKLVSNATCQEVILTGDKVDLRKLPLCTNNPDDGAPYITAGHITLKDPELGQNLSIYRMMYYSKNETFIRFAPGHDGYDFFKNAEKRGEKKFQVAVAIGVDPSIYIGSQFEPPLGKFELETAGGLKKESIEIVKCKTIDLEVPAHAEIVLEGEIDIPPKTGTEGPFGEFCGYTTSKQLGEKIITIKAITHRKNPIYHNIWLGKPPHEHLYVNAFSYGVQAYNELHPVYQAVKRAYCPPWGVSLVLLLQIEKRFKRPGLVPNILASTMATRSGHWKHVIAVDEDINIYDPNEILWAITTRFQPHRDLLIMPSGITAGLEPSATAEGVTSKLLIDATTKPDFRGTVAEPTREMQSKIESRWTEYGLGQRPTN